MFIYERKLILILLLTIMCTMAMIPGAAYAAAEKTTFKQEFTYREGETPNIQKEISQFGRVFTLVSVSDPVATASLPQNRSYTTRLSAAYTPGQLSRAPKNVKLTPVYGTGKRQVDRLEAVKELPDNDVDRLAQRKVYKDTNGRGPDARASGELVLAEVKYEVTGRDADGIPSEYTAHVIYRGEETYRKLLFYEGVTTYTTADAEADAKAGEGVSTYTVVATYEREEAENDGLDGQAAAGVGGSGAEGGGSAGEASGGGISALFSLPFSLSGISPVGAAAIATLAAAALTLLILGLYNRRRLRAEA